MKEYFCFFGYKLNQFHYIKPDKFPITGQLTNIIPRAPQMAWYLLYLRVFCIINIWGRQGYAPMRSAGKFYCNVSTPPDSLQRSHRRIEYKSS